MLVVVGAHPDDAEVGAAGLLLAAKSLGYETGIVVLTRGEGGASGSPEERLLEAKQGAAILKVDRWTCLDLSDTAVVADRSAQEALEAIFVAWRPRIIVTHAKEDWNGDHRAASELVDRAWALANRPKRHGSRFLARPKLLHFSVDPLRKGRPDILIDISSYVEVKKAALEAFVSQKVVLQRVLDYNALWGRACGVAFAEDFYSPEPLLLHGGLALL